MNIAITGSIATDHLMSFPGRFTEQFVDGHLDRVSLSFLASSLTVRPGGVGANIALGLARLGHSPKLVGAAGRDFAEYRAELEREGVDTSAVRVSATEYTARFICTSDAVQNQIATFYPGAMSEAAEISLGAVAERTGRFDLVLIGADDPDAMLRHAEECRTHGLPFAADPSQQLARLDGDAIKSLVEGATYLFTNDYERALLGEKTGWSETEIRDRVAQWVTTRGADGVRIESRGAAPAEVPAVPAGAIADPTGVGDGFRAGMLAGLAWDLSLERAAQVGCALATLVLGGAGPQDYRVDKAGFLADLAGTYGLGSAADVEPHLPTTAATTGGTGDTAAAEAGARGGAAR
ncbi:MAG: carbohydrate kinase family protein [Streptosporangiales bacterium]|nr:carbohydrate kinase family protein [Streptosporangiales bacterium]